MRETTMASSKITFPVVSKGVRRNAETGVEILNDADGWHVKTFHADKGDLFSHYDSHADALTAAVKDVEIMREEIAEAYSEAVEINADREIHAITGSIKIDGRPAEVTEILNEAELET